MSRLQSRQRLFHSRWAGTACVIVGGRARTIFATDIAGPGPLDVYCFRADIKYERRTAAVPWDGQRTVAALLRGGGINLGEAIIPTTGGGRTVWQSASCTA